MEKDIDWERCRKHLEGIYPEVETSLREGIDKVYKRTYSISLFDFPPHIILDFDEANRIETSGGLDRDIRKNLDSISKLIGNTAEKHNLLAYREKDKYTFTIKPKYKEFARN